MGETHNHEFQECEGKREDNKEQGAKQQAGVHFAFPLTSTPPLLFLLPPTLFSKPFSLKFLKQGKAKMVYKKFPKTRNSLNS